MAERNRRAATLPTESDSDAPSVTPPAASPLAVVPGSVRLLVSASSLGENVRYDGRHKYDVDHPRSAMAPCAR